MKNLALTASAMALATLGIAQAEVDRPGDLAANLAGRWHLTDDAVMVADAATKRPLLCIAATAETGDTLITERQAELACQARVARWVGGSHWVRISGLARRWSGDARNQALMLFAFADPSGPSDDEVARWLELAVRKSADRPSSPIEVQRGLSGTQP